MSYFKKIVCLTGKDTRSNWERLSGCTAADDGWLCSYSLVEELWNDIEPLYSRLVKYVHTRLKQVYNVKEELLPVEFLGSLSSGEEGWLGAAASIVPHRRFHDELKEGLKDLGDAGKLHLSTEQLIRSIGIGSHNGHHLSKIIPNCSRCFLASGELLSYCQEGLSEVLVPNNTIDVDVNAWFSAHEISMKAGLLKSLTDGSLPAYELALENHPLNEAIVQLAPSLAIKRLALAGGLIPDDVLQDENAEGSALLISALRILPKLAYYHMADKFRIEHLENSIEDGKLAELWRKAKQNYMQVTSTNITWDMLTDKHIVKNRPHLAAFLGIVLHYEILDRIDENGMQNVLRKFARESSWPAANWQEALKEHLGIERLVAEPLLDYFQPLYDYMDRTENIKQIIVPVISRTTTTSTTTTTASPTTSVLLHNQTTASTLQPTNHPRLDIKVTLAPVKEDDESSHNISSHTTAIAGALIGLFVLLVIVGLIGRRKWTNRRRARRPKPPSSPNTR